MKNIVVYDEITVDEALKLYRCTDDVYADDHNGDKGKLRPHYEYGSHASFEELFWKAASHYNYGNYYEGKFYKRRVTKVMSIKELKKGTYFTRKSIEYPTDSQVWVRGDYVRSEGKYEIYKFSDVNHTSLIKGDKEVFTDFTF